VLFKPSDIGINEGGISDMIAQITSSRVPYTMEPVMLSNLIVGGGNTRIPGFGQRLRNEIE
jgi:actin-related protein